MTKYIQLKYALVSLIVLGFSVSVLGQNFKKAEIETIKQERVDQYLQLLSEESKARTDYLKSLSQTSLNNSKTNQVADALLKYSQFIRDESRDHQLFLEFLYKISAGFLAGMVIVFSAILAWLNWKTKKDIRNEVDEQFKKHAHSQIESRLQEFNEHLQGMQDSSEQQMRNVNKLILDIIQQTTFFESIHSSSNSSSPTTPKSSPSHRFVDKKILWVDDYPQNNDYPREILSQNGVKFTLALSTEQALNLIEGKSFDLIISDMGRGNNPQAGLEFIKFIKNKGCNTPIIIFSSSEAIDKYGPQALELGAKYTVVGFAPLLQVISQLLR